MGVAVGGMGEGAKVGGACVAVGGGGGTSVWGVPHADDSSKIKARPIKYVHVFW
jgi:hypothetical protein